jgi:hypothetical protein
MSERLKITAEELTLAVEELELRNNKAEDSEARQLITSEEIKELMGELEKQQEIIDKRQLIIQRMAKVLSKDERVEIALNMIDALDVKDEIAAKLSSTIFCRVGVGKFALSDGAIVVRHLMDVCDYSKGLACELIANAYNSTLPHSFITDKITVKRAKELEERLLCVGVDFFVSEF